jgi:hypothetical protein
MPVLFVLFYLLVLNDLEGSTYAICLQFLNALFISVYRKFNRIIYLC